MPIVVIGVLLVALLVPESRDPRPGRVDVLGVLLSIVGLVALAYGIIDGGEHGFGRPTVWAAILGGVAVLAGFVVHERRSDHPSLDVRLFREPRFAAPVGIVGLVFFAAMGVDVLQLPSTCSWSGATARCRPACCSCRSPAAQLVFAPRSAAMVRRFGGRAVATVGLVLTSVALAAFAFIDVDTPIWVVLVAFFVQGVGMANIMPPATESIMSALPREKAGVGSAVSNTVRQVGGALGVAILGSVLSAVYRQDIAATVDRPARPGPGGGHRVGLRGVRGGGAGRPGGTDADRGGQRGLRLRHALGGGDLRGGGRPRHPHRAALDAGPARHRRHRHAGGGAGTGRNHIGSQNNV